MPWLFFLKAQSINWAEEKTQCTWGGDEKLLFAHFQHGSNKMKLPPGSLSFSLFVHLFVFLSISILCQRGHDYTLFLATNWYCSSRDIHTWILSASTREDMMNTTKPVQSVHGRRVELTWIIINHRIYLLLIAWVYLLFTIFQSSAFPSQHFSPCPHSFQLKRTIVSQNVTKDHFPWKRKDRVQAIYSPSPKALHSNSHPSLSGKKGRRLVRKNAFHLPLHH